MNFPHSQCDQTAPEIAALRAQEGKVKFAVQVIADDSGEYTGNGLRFDTVKEALDYAEDLAWRWTLVQKYKIVVAEA